GGVDARIIAPLVLVQSVVRVEGVHSLGTALRGVQFSEGLLLQETRVQRGQVLYELQLVLCILIVVPIPTLGLLLFSLAIAIVNPRAAKNAVHGEKRVLAGFSNAILQHSNGTGQRKT